MHCADGSKNEECSAPWPWQDIRVGVAKRIFRGLASNI